MSITHRIARVILLVALALAFSAPFDGSARAAYSPPFVHGVTADATAMGEDIVVHASSERTALRTLTFAENSWRLLAHRFATAPEDPVLIVVVEDPDEYETIQPAPMTRGFATFGGNRIYLRGTDLDQEVVTHEMAHILLGKNVRRGLAIPDWFNEGFAQHVSDSDGHRLRMFYSAAAGRLLPIAELDQVDALDGPDRELATVEGLGIVKFLVDRYGEDALWDLISRLSHARTFSQALLDTYGRSDLELSDEWLAYASDEYGILSIVGLETVGTAALGMLALIAAAVWATTKIRLRSDPRSPHDLSAQEIEEAERAAASLDPPDDVPPTEPHW